MWVSCNFVPIKILKLKLKLPLVVILAVHLVILCWMGFGDHPKTFLLKALCCQPPPSALKVMGGGGWWWPRAFYCQHWDCFDSWFSILDSQSQSQSQSQSLDNYNEWQTGEYRWPLLFNVVTKQEKILYIIQICGSRRQYKGWRRKKGFFQSTLSCQRSKEL